jgi:pimeloyl-ACP methyl ester carboxylesterase
MPQSGGAPKPKRSKSAGGAPSRATTKARAALAAVAKAVANAPEKATYAPALHAGVNAAVQTVQDMHHAIADKTFDGLQRIPGLSMPTRIVQGVHDAITQGVYAAVRHGSGAVLSAAGVAERFGMDATRSPQGPERAMRNALNGVFGDALATAGSSLSVSMALHRDGAPLNMEPASMAALGERVCVFIHGLACDEQSWWRSSEAWAGHPLAKSLPPGDTVHYGRLLAQDAGISAVYLRYNTGVSVAGNSQQLAEQLDALVKSAPKLRELLLIGHSMGGLLARGACELAAAQDLPWLRLVRMVICLGTPHQGAFLEKAGHVADVALGVSKVTQPLARLANARSRGIKDLRHGLKTRPKAGTPPPPPHVALRLVAASLGDASENALASMFGRAFGDGLVMPSSAVDDGLAGDVERVELAGLGHMALLNHPRVYAQIRDWIEALGPLPAR